MKEMYECASVLIAVELDFYSFVRNLNEEFVKLRVSRLLRQHDGAADAGNSVAETQP